MSKQSLEKAFQAGQTDYGMRLLCLHGFLEDAKILFREKHLDDLSDGTASTEKELMARALHGARTPRKKQHEGDRA
jgi:hypothetical protein